MVDKKEIKRGEQKLKNIMGGKLVQNAEFIRLLKANHINNTSKTWNNINKQIKMELNGGILTCDEVEERVYQLIVMQSPHDRLITLKEADAGKIENAKKDILSKGSISIQIPYTSSGVGDVVIGGAVLGRGGAVLGALNEGATKWKASNLVIRNEGINVKSTGNVVLYEDIKRVVLGEKSFVHTIVTVIKHNGDALIFKAVNIHASAIKSIIDERILAADNTPSIEEHVEVNDAADTLLKYADLYERGLLTREEFDEKKEQLLHNNDNIDLEQNQQDVPSFCTNCGHKIVEGSAFCSNCGKKIIR